MFDWTNVWQTTNQQPWVEAIAQNVISAKTRMSKPCVPVGATILLHSSKSKLWPHWQNLTFLSKLMDSKSWPRGVIQCIATVKEVGLFQDVLTKREQKIWDVLYTPDEDEVWYNSCADWAIRFSDVVVLDNPVAAKGMQAPFARAKPEVIRTVRKTLGQNE